MFIPVSVGYGVSVWPQQTLCTTPYNMQVIWQYVAAYSKGGIIKYKSVF